MFPIFRKLGGEQAALDLIASKRGGFERAGARPSRTTLFRWRHEGIPGHVQSILADECAARGIRCSFDDMKWKPRSEKAA